MRGVVLLTLLLLGHAGAAVGQQPEAPRELEFAVSGGRWSEGSAQGHYRVLIYTGGFDHIISEAYVEWIKDPITPTDTLNVLVRVPINQANIFMRVAGAPVFRGNEVSFQLIDTHSPGRPNTLCLIHLGGFRQVTGACR